MNGPYLDDAVASVNAAKNIIHVRILMLCLVAFPSALPFIAVRASDHRSECIVRTDLGSRSAQAAASYERLSQMAEPDPLPGVIDLTDPHDQPVTAPPTPGPAAGPPTPGTAAGRVPPYSTASASGGLVRHSSGAGPLPREGGELAWRGGRYADRSRTPPRLRSGVPVPPPPPARAGTGRTVHGRAPTPPRLPTAVKSGQGVFQTMVMPKAEPSKPKGTPAPPPQLRLSDGSPLL